MKPTAIALTLSFLFTALFLSFTLATCGTANTPICASIFGMNNNACEANPLEHHTAITEQSTLCTLDAFASAATLSLGVLLSIIITLSFTPLLTRIVARASIMATTRLHPLRIMNPFDPLRFAFAKGTIQQRRNVRHT